MTEHQEPMVPDRYGTLPTTADLRDVGADIVILPMGRDDQGRGLYERDAVFVAKDLRAAGVNATFLDPPGRRLFEVRNSAVGAAVGVLALAVVSGGAYDAVKWLVNRVLKSRPDMPLEYRIVDASSDNPQVRTLTGNPADVLAAIEKLQSNQVIGDDNPVVAIPTPTADERTNEQIDVGLDRARAMLEFATAAVEEARADVPPSVAEVKAREALGALASALNWAEDGSREAVVHQTLDQAGRWVRNTFGCRLTREGHSYYQDCPVALAHNRFGLSIGGYGRKVCSICGQDLSECEHQRGVTYRVPGGSAKSGRCPVCVKDACDHSPDTLYEVELTSIVVEMLLEEISFVSKPAMPDARATRISIDADDLLASLGEEFEVGMDVSCDRCLEPCEGLRKPNFGGSSA